MHVYCQLALKPIKSCQLDC